MQLFEEGRGDELAIEGNNCGLGCGAVCVCFVKGLQKKLHSTLPPFQFWQAVHLQKITSSMPYEINLPCTSAAS